MKSIKEHVGPAEEEGEGRGARHVTEQIEHNVRRGTPVVAEVCLLYNSMFKNVRIKHGKNSLRFVHLRSVHFAIYKLHLNRNFQLSNN